MIPYRFLARVSALAGCVHAAAAGSLAGGLWFLLVLALFERSTSWSTR